MRWKLWSSSKEEIETRGISLLERVIKSLPAILIGIALTFFLSRSGIFRQLETYALDTQVRLQGAEHDSDVAVVRIDDEDYQNLFSGKSPLDHKNLLRVINAIAAGQPRVIGIDVDTAPHDFREMQVPSGGPAIIWARNGSFSHRDQKYHLSGLLGGQNTDAKFGVVVMRLDPDGAIRRYPRVCESNLGPVPSFPWQVAKAFDPEVGKHEPTEDNLFIGFAGDREASHRLHFTAARILSLADGPGWQTDSPIKDKVVLLGGAYGTEDEHDTPLGWMLGVEVLGYAIETELRGGGTEPASPVLVTVLGGFAGLMLLLCFQHFRPSVAILISVVTVPVLGIVGSLLAFRSMAFWAYFVPIPLAVLTQETYYHAKDYRKKVIKQLYEGVVGKTEDAVDTTEDATVDKTKASEEKPVAKPDGKPTDQPAPAAANEKALTPS